MNEPLSDPPSEEPKFGLVDVIEAFTAMRHEFRTQSTEDRKLAEQLAGATEQIRRLEQSIQQSANQLQSERPAVKSNVSADELNLRRLCETLAEVDFHLSRTVQIAIDSLGQGNSADDPQKRLREHFEQQINLQVQRTSRWRRWLLGSWPRQLLQSLEPPANSITAAASSSLEALRMLQDRVARLVREAGIERIDVAGKPFDGTLMNAVESVPCRDVPAGHIVTQLCPAYRWRDTIVRYAEVNVSKG